MCEKRTHHNGQFDTLKDTKETNRLQNYTTEFIMKHTRGKDMRAPAGIQATTLNPCCWFNYFNIHVYILTENTQQKVTRDPQSVEEKWKLTG